ncbi:molybdopterin dinucleotide binding domain-containing protein [Thalassolituus sp.]|jgi:anaerobic selenocysteine-containing dehydrogenase|uniref:molybdopterin dinucleotide binding domain-containing protein n=1 Tax=Thalassolituus sp. TaxID=2030822 RepID=UPI002A809BD9|nr:molybdopterin dinucleotide binding domain-containing protein [Thalassolituus sp.]
MSVRSEGQFNSIIYEETDSYRGVDNRWTVLLNPDDMKAMALSAGDKVDVVSAHCVMKSVHAQPFDIPQGNVMAYYPEADVLIGLDRDKRSHTPAFKSVAVQLVY